MYNRRVITNVVIHAVCCLFLVVQAGRLCAEPANGQAEKAYVLKEVQHELSETSLRVRFVGSSQPSFASRELYDPYRLVIDISDMGLAAGVSMDHLIPENKLVSLQTTVVRGQVPEITRMIFTIAPGYAQKLERDGSDLVVNITPVSAAAKNDSSQVTTPSVSSDAGKDASNAADAEKRAAEEKIRALIESSAQQQEAAGSGEMAAKSSKDSFSFAGYEKERISIDFYKIDLHNVFRLFRQISGVNLIVDEGVKGTLTLALKDVPWDFALDIILNLSDLSKEEKFNTIVIYPKDKEFVWPARVDDNLSFEENLQVTQQESLIIEQTANLPKEIMQAKDLMRSARESEKDGKYEDATKSYEKAFTLWPDNDVLASRLAALYIVRQGMNAKGLYYAKKSLEIKGEGNYIAALYAAIGSANMNHVPDAVEYFTQSMSGNPPMKEALGSFAAFSETTGRLDSALKLYDTYHKYYGESLNTLVAKARIYDRLGQRNAADEQYRSVLASGYQVPAGLKSYIESRLSGAAR